MSRLLDVVPDAQKTKEPDDQEFGSYCFEELEPAKVMEKVSTEVIELNDNSELPNDSQELRKSLEKPDVKENSTDEKNTQDADSEFQEHSQNLRTIVVQNIHKAREKLPKKEEEPHNFKVNDMVLVKDPDAAVFEPRYQPNFRVTAIFGNNRIEVQDERGHKSIRRSAHVKYIAPSEKVVKQLPSEQLLKNYGRSSKLLLAEKDIPDLHFDITETKEKGDSSEKTEVMEIMDVNTKRSVMAPQNSDF